MLCVKACRAWQIARPRGVLGESAALMHALCGSKCAQQLGRNYARFTHCTRLHVNNGFALRDAIDKRPFSVCFCLLYLSAMCYCYLPYLIAWCLGWYCKRAKFTNFLFVVACVFIWSKASCEIGKSPSFDYRVFNKIFTLCFNPFSIRTN